MALHFAFHHLEANFFLNSTHVELCDSVALLAFNLLESVMSDNWEDWDEGVGDEGAALRTLLQRLFSQQHSARYVQVQTVLHLVCAFQLLKQQLGVP